jgi:hypothetical protein
MPHDGVVSIAGGLACYMTIGSDVFSPATPATVTVPGLNSHHDRSARDYAVPVNLRASRPRHELGDR